MTIEATPTMQFLFHIINNNYKLTDTQYFKFVATLAHLGVLK